MPSRLRTDRLSDIYEINDKEEERLRLVERRITRAMDYIIVGLSIFVLFMYKGLI